MKKKENGNAPVMFIFVFFMIFLLFGVAATMMTYAQVMTHQHEIDDDLCDSVLSSMVVDLDRYNNEQKAYGVQAPTNSAEIASLQAQLSAKIAEQNQHRTNATKARQDETAYQKQADDLEKQADSYTTNAIIAEQNTTKYQNEAEKYRAAVKEDQNKLQRYRSELPTAQNFLTGAQNGYNYWKKIDDTIKTAQDLKNMDYYDYMHLCSKIKSAYPPGFHVPYMPSYWNLREYTQNAERAKSLMNNVNGISHVESQRYEWEYNDYKNEVADLQGNIGYFTDKEQRDQAQAASYDQQAAQKRQEAQNDRAKADACQKQAQEKRNLSAQAKQTAEAEDAAAKALQPDIDRLRQQLTLLSQKPTDQVAVFYKSVDNSFSLYKSCFDNARRQNDPAFFQNFSYDTYILYEVDPKQNQITVTSFSPNGQKTVTTGTCGSIQTPDGKKVTETSAYAKVSFAVKTYFRNIPAMQKARQIYCTIDQTNYLQK